MVCLALSPKSHTNKTQIKLLWFNIIWTKWKLKNHLCTHDEKVSKNLETFIFNMKIPTLQQIMAFTIHSSKSNSLDYSIQLAIFWNTWFCTIYASFWTFSSCTNICFNWSQCIFKQFYGLPSYFSIFFFNHPHLPFNTTAIESFTCLKARGWLTYSKPISKASLISYNFSIGCFWISSITGLSSTYRL